MDDCFPDCRSCGHEADGYFCRRCGRNLCGHCHDADEGWCVYCTCESEGDRHDPEGLDSEGCCYPGRCLMPGSHIRHECHTVEDVEALEREANR